MVRLKDYEIKLWRVGLDDLCVDTNTIYDSLGMATGAGYFSGINGESC